MKKLNRRQAWEHILKAYEALRPEAEEPDWFSIAKVGLCFAVNRLFEGHRDLTIGPSIYNVMKRDITSVAPPEREWMRSGHYWPTVAGLTSGSRLASERQRGIQCRIAAIKTILSRL